VLSRVTSWIVGGTAHGTARFAGVNDFVGLIQAENKSNCRANFAGANTSHREPRCNKRMTTDQIAVAGNPVADITELEHVDFVIKGGEVIRIALHCRDKR
jgi:hypothetical protein